MKKNFLATISLLFVFVGGLIAGVILVRQRQELREKADTPKEVLVSLSPDSYTLDKGGKTTLNIVLTNTSTPPVDVSLYASEVSLRFDPTSFSVSNLSCNSDFLPSVAASSVSGNVIYLACFSPGGGGAKTLSAGSQKVLGKFDITALNKDGESQISVIGANLPDSQTQTDLSGNTGLGGSYNIAAVGGPDSPIPTQSPSQSQSPVPTATPGPTAGPLNSCGGTCGSNANCQSNLTCYQGFCRNPSCLSVTSCSCPNTTAKPTPKVTAKASPATRATPIFVVSLSPSPSPFADILASPEATTKPEEGISQVMGFVIYGSVGLVFLVLIFLAIKLLFRRKSPPTSSPPVNPTYVPPVMPPPPIS